MDFPPKNEKILVSACLAGVNCTFRGTNNLDDKIKKLVDNKAAIALCPEVFARLGVPRENIELVGGNGFDVLDGKAHAISASGKDVTKELMAGANSVLGIVKIYGIKEAILKSKSPTCGSDTAGYGVLAALLKRNGIKVRTEKEV